MSRERQTDRRAEVRRVESWPIRRASVVWPIAWPRRRALGKRVVVVVSAMGKTTDELLALARTVDRRRRRGASSTCSLSCGERVSMALLSMAIEARGLSAISFTGSQSGILTNDRHSGARIIEVRPVRIEDELARGKVVIVAGFQGMRYKREITTLGRGGSDTTAVALAAALGAEYCEICSDVDGVYSADPRVVPEARRLDAAQLRRDAGAGRARRQGAERAGGRVGEEGAHRHLRAGDDERGRSPTEAPARRRASAARSFASVAARWRSPGRGASRVASARRAVRIVEGEGIALRHAGAGAACASSTTTCPIGRAWSSGCATGAHAIEERGEVTVVGAGVGSDAATVRRALAAAGQVHDWDASPLRLTLTVDSERTDEVTRALHAALISDG